MKRLALKIDVDTARGAREGVPPLLRLLAENGAGATFFLSLGRDYSGREGRADSLVRHYGFSTRISGSLVPAAEIGVRHADVLRGIESAGFETAIRAWDRVRWETRVVEADNEWTEKEMRRAQQRYAEIFGKPAMAHGAAGWRMNRHALRLTQRLDFSFASDCRGHCPFIPVIDGEIVACPQIPGTLPTLDEILALEPASTPEQAIDRMLKLAQAIPGDHVITLRAELEGLKFIAAGEHLLRAAEREAMELVSLGALYADLDVVALPRHVVAFGEIPGRGGRARMMQGPVFLGD